MEETNETSNAKEVKAEAEAINQAESCMKAEADAMKQAECCIIL